MVGRQALTLLMVVRIHLTELRHFGFMAEVV